MARRPSPLASVEDAEAEGVKALTEAEQRTLLALMPERQWLFIRVLACTGLRVSEAIALQWRHLHLDGSTPHVKVRRALVKGTMGAPKSRHSRRDVPLDSDLALALREHRRDSEWPNDDDLVFTVANGSAIMPGNLRRRVLKPTAQEAGVQGRLPQLPAHLRVAAVRAGPQRRAGAALARPPFGGVHAGDVCPPARRRSRRAAVSNGSANKLHTGQHRCGEPHGARCRDVAAIHDLNTARCSPTSPTPSPRTPAALRCPRSPEPGD
jgi:integrase